MKKTKSLLKAVSGSLYKKVYIINFERCSQAPRIKKTELIFIGDWFVSEGLEGICYSKLTIDSFEYMFLSLVEESDRSLVSFDVDIISYKKDKY